MENTQIFAFSATSGLHPKFSPVKYSYLPNSPLLSALMLAFCLSKSY